VRVRFGSRVSGSMGLSYYYSDIARMDRFNKVRGYDGVEIGSDEVEIYKFVILLYESA
jgi:hypothetical protein